MKTAGPDTEKFRFLADMAREAGAEDARIIPAERIVVEDRVREKCRTGCYEYGKYLTCPPHAPPVGDFRKSLRDYRHALVVRFRSGTEFREEIRHSLFHDLIDPSAKKESKESALAFVTAYVTEGQGLHKIMLDLEHAALNTGFTFALTTICGPGCRLCGSCNIATGICNHPTMKRHSPESLGINVIKTAADAGMPIRFPAPEHPERIAILLID